MGAIMSYASDARQFVSNRRRLAYGLGVVALVAIPLVSPNFLVAVALEALLLAMYAVSLDLLVGRTGLISFGQAAFFGVSAYTSGLILLYGVSSSAVVAIGIGVFVAVVVAALMGFIALRQHGLYFAMLTLALSQILYNLAINDFLGVTGGTDGIGGVPSGEFGIPGLMNIELTTMGYYYVIVVAFVLSLLAVKLVVNSPFGSVLIAIRENETRAKHGGYNVFRYKMGAFVISGVLAGVAGGLFVSYFNTLSPGILFWSFSGEALVMVLIGGMGTVIGPVLGAALFVTIREFGSGFVSDWRLLLGVVFVVFTIFLPRGLVSIPSFVRSLLQRFRR